MTTGIGGRYCCCRLVSVGKIVTINMVVVFLLICFQLKVSKTFFPRGLFETPVAAAVDNNDNASESDYNTVMTNDTTMHEAANVRLVVPSPIPRDEFTIIHSKVYESSKRNSSSSTIVTNPIRNDAVNGNVDRDSKTLDVPLNLVICATVRNEAPYLREWIEYHKLIGFDTFLLFDDHSTDDTDCVLYKYASEKGIVIRVPQDFAMSGNETTTTPREQYSTFQACQEYLTRSLTTEKASRTWMATLDVDEFLWFDQSATTTTGASSSSLKQIISNLLLQMPSQHQQQGGKLKQTPAIANVQSLVIPRLLFGSSGHEHYETDLVMNRFTRRFDAGSCPSSSSRSDQTSISTPLLLPPQPSRRRRRLFNHTQPTSYCISQASTKQRDKISSSFDNFKSMSKLSSLATKCHKINRETNQTEHAYCHNPHIHQLPQHHDISSDNSSTSTTSTLRNAARNFRNDVRYLGPNQVYPFMAIVHYRSKSRAEFYERACDSRFSGKYFECPDCTPESYFNLTETFSNLLEDHRMRVFARQLSTVMNGSSSNDDDDGGVDVSHCHVEPPSIHKSWDDYRSCFQKQSSE